MDDLKIAQLHADVQRVALERDALREKLDSCDKTLQSCEGAMKYAYEDRDDQYYLNVLNLIQATREALAKIEGEK